MNEDALKSTLFDFTEAACSSVVDLSITFAQQNAPIPDRPFVSIRLGAGDSNGEDEKVMDGETMVIRGNRRRTIQFMIFADSPSDVVEYLRQGVNRPSVHQILEAGGLAFVREAGTIDASKVMNNSWDGRAQVDFQFSFGAEYEDEPGVIEHGTFEGELEGGAAPIETAEDFDL